MKVSQVIAYFEKTGTAVNIADLKRFIFIEKTRPYHLLTNENTFVLCSDLRPLLSVEFFRQMECVVVTHLDERRWAVEVKDAIAA